jgi:hypothetical protein
VLKDTAATLMFNEKIQPDGLILETSSSDQISGSKTCA